MQDELSLREQKRLDTLIRIEDAATRLVDERDFSSVTVEEICEAAGISRRTFFNYFDSKEDAVLGGPSKDFTAQQRESFLTQPCDDILTLTMDLIKAHLAGHHRSPEISQRRRRIAADPQVAAAGLIRKRAKSQEITELIRLRLEQDPHLQRLSGVSVAAEAMYVAALAREAWWLAMISPDVDCSVDITERIDCTLHTLINYAKATTW